MHRNTSYSLFSCSLFFSACLAAETQTELPAMTVSSDFRPVDSQSMAASLTTFDAEIMEARGAQHLDELLNMAPNVNFASGASRGQFLQIRGIGERSQFAAPLNPSVGLIIDGIDFSRTGGAATLFDIEQVEVLRGPQGTRFGTNSLAGVVNMRSREPSHEPELRFQSTLGNYNTRSVGVAAGGTLIDETLLGRLAVHRHRSDGYMENKFLGRDNTQKQDEVTARGQLRWLLANDQTVDLKVLHLDINNGYDAFTFDNSRNSFADQPGEDKQRTTAFALSTDWRATDAVWAHTAFTYSNSDVTYSYDADWGFDSQFPVDPQCNDGDDDTPEPYTCPYIGFEEFQRKRENYSFEIRLQSDENARIFNNTTDWTLGIYYLQQDERFIQDSDFGIFGEDLVSGRYETSNTSLFGQLETRLTQQLTLISGLRVEYFDAKYRDSQSLRISPSETLFGGKVGLNYQLDDNHLWYNTLSRGYKSGGVNNDAQLPDNLKKFDTEYLWSLESGLKSRWLDGRLQSNLAAFYSLRRDAQVKNSTQIGPSFIDYIQNAARGTNAGIEAQLDWLVTSQWRSFASVGLLYTNFDKFESPENDRIKGRRQAHAPSYQYVLGSEFYLANHWTLRANIEGKDGFYYSDSHNAKSSSYALFNASLSYNIENWDVTLWGRNLFDRDYATRGFFFGNDPSIGYADRTYVQYGEPRVFGVTVSYDY